MNTSPLTSDLFHLSSILIANRGEISSRISRTCKKMGIQSIAVFSEADRNAPFVADADMAIFIGESTPAKSYLDQEKIIAAAKQVGAHGIHPGYGFLSENAGFAQRCAEEGLVFIGPNPEAIVAMGSKSKAKALMEAHHVPVVPGYKGEDQSVERLIKEAKNIGFPLLLKATAGGGGKGMRIVHEAPQLENAIAAAKRESKSAFGDDELIVEKYIKSGRHIEFQIFGDKHGNTIHLLERECSIQRRYQKVVEESPSPIMTDALRKEMGDAAVKAAQALKYDNAGTVEFIYDDQSGDFYFLEVNTRLQVEHPVTEEITGLDLVQMQIESAQGLPLQIKQEEVTGSGYAVEVRLYAENPAENFMPVTGTIQNFKAPDVAGLRIESAIKSGSEISIYYDPMIAKIIVWDQSRMAAHMKMKYVLRHLQCQGMVTNQAFLLDLFDHPDFTKGQYDTHFIDQKMDLTQMSNQEENYKEAAIAATLYDWHQRNQKRSLLRNLPSGWRNNFIEPQKESFVIGEEEIDILYKYKNGIFEIQLPHNDVNAQIISCTHHELKIELNGIIKTFAINTSDTEYYIHTPSIGNIHLTQKERFPIKEIEKIKGAYIAPMPSQIIKILLQAGDKVQSGQGLVILSSMKMENTIEATEDGIIEEVYVSEGENIEAGTLLIKMKS